MSALVLEVSCPLGYSHMGDGPNTAPGGESFSYGNDFQSYWQLISFRILLLPSSRNCHLYSTESNKWFMWLLQTDLGAAIKGRGI